MSPAATDPVAARVVERMRAPILALGIAAGGLLVARLFELGVADLVTIVGAVAAGLPALALFVCAVFDRRFHNALSVVNAERLEKARGKQDQRVGDPALHLASLALLSGVLIAAFRHDGPAVALALAGFNLLLLGNLATLTRGQPTDRFVG